MWRNSLKIIYVVSVSKPGNQVQKCQNVVCMYYYFYFIINMKASVVQWLGFHPSKVEVRVRFTAVALHAIKHLQRFAFAVVVLWMLVAEVEAEVGLRPNFVV